MPAEISPHSAPTARSDDELLAAARELYPLISSGQHGLAYAVGTGGPALISREKADDEGDASQVDRRVIRVRRFVGEVPKFERAKELLPDGKEIDRKFNPWTLSKHLRGAFAVAPMAGGWVQWAALDIDAHLRKGESELDARRRAKRVLGGVWRALGCSAIRHPLLLRSPGGGYHVWLPLTRGSTSANPEHTWPAEMVRRCVEWHLRQSGLELGKGEIEVFPSGVGLRAPCGRGMVLLQASQPDNPDALGLMPWSGTATVKIDVRGEELTTWKRQVVPTVRAFVEQWALQRRTLADWLNRPEFGWEAQWGCLGWRDGHNDIPRWREIYCGEKNPAQITQGKSRSQQSDDELSCASGPPHVGGKGKGGVGRSRKDRRSGSSIKNDQLSPSAPEVSLSPDSAGGKLVRGREFREKYTRLLLEGITQPSTRYDAGYVLVFYWGATCGLPHDEVLRKLEEWCLAYPHQGSRHGDNKPAFVKECLREARSYLKCCAPGWRFRGGGHAGGLVTLKPDDRAVTAAVDPRVEREAGTLLSWLAGRADADGRVLDPVQISHGLLRRLCGERRVDIDDDGRRHRVATVVLRELERLGVLTLASNYRVGRRGRMWSCWYQFGSGELPRVVALPAAKWDQIAPFTTEPLVASAALLEVVDSKPQELTSAPLVEVRVLGERVVSEGLLSVLSNCARGLPRALLTCAPGVESPTAAPALRPPWYERSLRLLKLTPRRLWRADVGRVGPSIEDLRAMPRSMLLEIGGGGRDAAGRVSRRPSGGVTGSSAPAAQHMAAAEVSSPSSPLELAAPAAQHTAAAEVSSPSSPLELAAPTAQHTAAAEVSSPSSLMELAAPTAQHTAAAEVSSPSSPIALAAPAALHAPSAEVNSPSSPPELAAPAALHAPPAEVNSPSSPLELAAPAALHAPPAEVNSPVLRARVAEEVALRTELAAATDAAFAEDCDADLLETLCEALRSHKGRGRGS